MPIARWSLISKFPAIARSSHGISVTNTGLLVTYGGELKPRIPVDNKSDVKEGYLKGSVHLFDLRASPVTRTLPTESRPLTQNWVTLSPSTHDLGEIPIPRVGATIVWEDDHLYLWGGRGGIDMAPLQGDQVGFYRGKLALTEKQSEAASVVEWEQFPAANPTDAPEPRSYHCSVAHKGIIYIHAGCPTSGRLSTLHSFNVANRTWKALASAPDPPRGGTALAVADITTVGPILLRYGGFSGYQLPDPEGTVDIYDITANKWHTVQPSPDGAHGVPGARSVHGLVPFQSTSPNFASSLALLYHGESVVSSLGHAGAGAFYDDVWLLSKDQTKGLLEGWSWKKVDVPDGQPKPEARGWFPPAAWVDGQGQTHAVLHGGLLSSNERSDELWLLDVE